MKKEYIAPAITAMAMQPSILANSFRTTISNSCPTNEPTLSTSGESDNQFSKEHTFDLWDE